MRIRITNLFLILFVLAGSVHSQAGPKDLQLRVYLPREMVVKGDSIDLGTIGVIRGDEKLVAKASTIGLGKFSVTGQQVVIDKDTILSRLASNGIKPTDVQLSGAESVQVRRDEKIIDGSRFIETALSFIRSQTAQTMLSSVEAVSKPKSWALNHDGEVRLVARLESQKRPDRAQVRVAVVSDGKEVDSRTVWVRLKYKQQKVTATANIEKGALLNLNNIKIESSEGAHPQRQDWSPPYGMVAKQTIRKGSVIKDTMICPVEKPLMIERKQIVVLKIETAGLIISNLGTALSDGKVGDIIRVKVENPNRQERIVVGKVKPNGTVEPVY